MSVHEDNYSAIVSLQSEAKKRGYDIEIDGHMPIESKIGQPGQTYGFLLNLIKALPVKLISPDKPIAHSEIPAIDERSEKNIATLHERFKPIARSFMVAIRAELGDFRITSGYRSYEEQNELYAQGRTKDGEKVTRARGGFSVHNFGLAFDITLFVNGKPVYESPLYKKAGLKGEQMGLDWAGGGTGADFNDEPHFEWPGATKNISLYRTRKAEGKDVLEG